MFHVKQCDDDNLKNKETQGLEEDYAPKILRQLRKILVGNGLKKEEVRLKTVEGAIYTLNGSLSLQPAARVREERVAGRRTAGQVVQAGEAVAAAKAYADGLGKNDGFRQSVRALLQNRPGQGFGISREPIVMEAAAQSFTEHETCRPCQGEGQSPCSVCQARGQKTCDKCRGLRESTCYVCKGQGVANGANGQNTQCYACQGRRVLQCDMCRGTGQSPCPNCNATGRSQCAHCQGNGAATKIIHVNVDAVPDFKIEQAHLPPALYETLLKLSPERLAAKGDLLVEMKAAQPQPKSYYEQQSSHAGWVEHYHAPCPWALATASVKGRALTCHAIGDKARLVNLPPILDDVLKEMIHRLHRAARGQAAPFTVLERACRRKITRETLPLLLAKGKRKALKTVMHAYPIGLSDGAAKAMISGLSGVIARITRWPTILACLCGCFVNAGLLVVWFFAGGRVGVLPQGQLFIGFIIDIALIAGLAFMAVLIIRQTEKTVLRRCFQRLKLPPQLIARMPRAGYTELIALCATVGIGLAVIILAGAQHVPWLALIGQ